MLLLPHKNWYPISYELSAMNNLEIEKLTDFYVIKEA